MDSHDRNFFVQLCERLTIPVEAARESIMQIDVRFSVFFAGSISEHTVPHHRAAQAYQLTQALGRVEHVRDVVMRVRLERVLRVRVQGRSRVEHIREQRLLSLFSNDTFFMSQWGYSDSEAEESDVSI